MSITRQTPVFGAGTTTAVATWASATTLGSLLLAVCVADSGVTSGTPTFTAPAGGWTALTYQGATGGQHRDPGIQLFYIENAASQSGAKTWSAGGASPSDFFVYMWEVTATGGTLTFDQQAGTSTGSGTGTTDSTGTTGNLAQTGEYCAAAGGAKNAARTFATPANSFSIIRQDQGTGGTSGVAAWISDLVGGTSGATLTTSVQVNVASQNSGVLATFKLVAGGTTWTVAGSAAGAATCSGGLTETKAARGSAAGAASCSGAVVETKQIAGSAAGVAVASGRVVESKQVAGGAAGVAACAGALTVTFAVRGAAAGAAACSGGLLGVWAVAGSAAGVASASGALTVTHAVRGGAAGVTSCAGTVGLGIAGYAAGIATCVGSVDGGAIVTATGGFHDPVPELVAAVIHNHH